MDHFANACSQWETTLRRTVVSQLAECINEMIPAFILQQPDVLPGSVIVCWDDIYTVAWKKVNTISI